MFEFLRTYQLSIMLILSGMCVLTAFFVLLMVNTSAKRRTILFSLQIGAAILLISDRFAYIYRGDVSATGYWSVRVYNFLVFLMTLVESLILNFYLIDLYRDEGGMKKTPRRLQAASVILILGMLALVAGHITGGYYYFDEFNQYHRGQFFWMSYVFPAIAVLLQLIVMIQYVRRINTGI